MNMNLPSGLSKAAAKVGSELLKEAVSQGIRGAGKVKESNLLNTATEKIDDLLKGTKTVEEAVDEVEAERESIELNESIYNLALMTREMGTSEGHEFIANVMTVSKALGEGRISKESLLAGLYGRKPQ